MFLISLKEKTKRSLLFVNLKAKYIVVVMKHKAVLNMTF